MSRGLCAVMAGCLCLGAHAAAGQTVLTLEGVLARARDQAGAPAVARARVAEAESGLVDVSARYRNPVIDGGVGPRFGTSGRTADIDLGFSQPLETSAGRRARIDGVVATVDRRRAEADTTSRGAMLDAASAFVHGLAATEQVRIAEEVVRLDRELLSATERRYAAGDVSAIDVNLARLEAARSAAMLGSAAADLTSALGRLRAILRMAPAEPLRLDGSLEPPPLVPLERLEASAQQRPEFAALEAELRAADSETQLGHALGRPELGIRAGYEREGGDNIFLGGLTVTLPAFQRGRGLLAAGAARATRARLEIETLRAQVLADLRTAYAVTEQRTAVAEALSQAALPTVADNEELGRRSYDAGEMNLMDLLLIRRTSTETRLTVVSRRLEAALGRLEVDYLAGVIR